MTEQEYKDTYEKIAKAGELQRRSKLMNDMVQWSDKCSGMKITFDKNGQREDFTLNYLMSELLPKETLAAFASAIHDRAVKEAEKAQAEFDAL